VLVSRDGTSPECPSQIVRLRSHNKLFVVGLAGVADADAARRLHGASVLAARLDLPRLPPRTFREIDLVGLLVVDETLGVLGTVQSVRRYPACDMLVVGQRELLVPLLAAYGVSIDRKKREIRVRLPRGFEEL
jgi:16S rRNA processing protein RimM